MTRTHDTHTSFKLKFIPQRSQLYPFEFLGVSTPKPTAKNGIPKNIWFRHCQSNIMASFQK